MAKEIHIDVESADIRRFQADVVALKFSGALIGGAYSAAKALGVTEAELTRRLPAVGSLYLAPGQGRIGATHALFLAVVQLPFFNYVAIRRFGYDVLKGLSALAPETRHLAITIHGTSAGLDVASAVRAEIEGFIEAVGRREFPAGLETISIVDRHPPLVERIRLALLDVLPTQTIAVDQTGGAQTTPTHRVATRGTGSRFDVFVCYKSADTLHARQVYDLLGSRGLTVFFSRESLPALGSDEYQEQIDAAIDNARHMVVVTSSGAHAQAKWVQYEWRLFLGEKLAGRKTGNLVTVIAGEMAIGDLPISLRNREVIPLVPGKMEHLFDYVRPDSA